MHYAVRFKNRRGKLQWKVSPTLVTWNDTTLFTSFHKSLWSSLLLYQKKMSKDCFVLFSGKQRNILVYGTRKKRLYFLVQFSLIPGRRNCNKYMMMIVNMKASHCSLRTQKIYTVIHFFSIQIVRDKNV